MSCQRAGRQNGRQGVILPLLAVMGVFLMVIVVFFVDVAYMHLARTQLRAATDAAAKAACEAINGNHTPAEIKQIAIDIAAANEVGGEPLTLVAGDIELGQSTEQPDGSWAFTPGLTPATAVKVTAFKSNTTAAGAVRLFFAPALGISDFTPSQSSTASQFEHEVMLCIDRSGSMAWDLSGVSNSFPSGHDLCTKPDKNLSRWASLEDGVITFLNVCEANGTHMQQTVGLVTWASEKISECDPMITFSASTLEEPLGYQYSTMRSKIKAIGDASIQGATDMSAGLDTAIAELTGPSANPTAKKTIILFTDGQWNQGSDPATRATTAAANDITIHVVSFLDGVDQTEMNNIAATTGGTHYAASNEVELIAAFDELARNLPVVLTE